MFDQRFEPTTTQKYELIKTADVIKSLQDKGYKLDDFIPLKVRKKEKQGFQKHRAIFSHQDLGEVKGEGKLQLLITNAHDGSSSFKIQLGFFRLVCSNGLVIGTTHLTQVVRHTGKDTLYNVEKAIEKIVAQAPLVLQQIESMKKYKVSSEQFDELVQEGGKLRDELGKQFNVTVRRDEDKERDLFTVLNVVQENIIRGGATYIDASNKQKTLRRTRSFVTQSKVNEKLWNIAERFIA